MTRPHSPFLDSMIGVKIPVLDHGFIIIRDYMGVDKSIADAARVSYGDGTRTVNDDAGLISYLVEHQHSSPLEMCLGGDVKVPTFPKGRATVKHYTMRQIAEAFEKGGKENAWVKLLKIRTVNPQTGVVTATKIKRAWKTGVKKVYRVTTEAPFFRSIVLTENHPILTPNGFRKLEEGLAVGDSIMLNGVPALSEDVVAEVLRRREEGQSIVAVSAALNISPSTVYKYSKFRAKRKTGFFKKPQGEHKDPRAIARRRFTLGMCEVQTCGKYASDRHHIDENPHNNAPDNIAFLCSKHHRHVHTRSALLKAVPCKIAKIEELGEQEVFDLEVVDDNHTFVADGVVVHNCEIKLHIKLPLFVARQWIRHRTANVNEESARYSLMCKEFYTPSSIDMAEQSKNNKQGRGEALTPEQAQRAADKIESFSRIARFNYESLLNEEALARELARMNITLNYYTQWVWKCDLRNLLHFIKLRMDPHAQLEIRRYAEELWRIVYAWVPAAATAFEEHQLYATHFSKVESEILRQIVNQDGIKEKIAHLKPRQQAAFLAKLGLE